jgi:hypothetical protein
LWPGLREDDKSAICSALKNAISAIHKIHHPGFYGSVARGPVPYHLLYSKDGDTAICGPFNSESEFNAGFIGRLRAIWVTNMTHSFKADFYERRLDTLL